jgi:hypothetical protein
MLCTNLHAGFLRYSAPDAMAVLFQLNDNAWSEVSRTECVSNSYSKQSAAPVNEMMAWLQQSLVLDAAGLQVSGVHNIALCPILALLAHRSIQMITLLCLLQAPPS